jgi:hypothetical protein
VSHRHVLLPGAFVLYLAAATSVAAQSPNPYPGPPTQGAYPADSSMRLQVKPRDTQVFVDGYYAGIADDFDGAFQRLHLEAGQHSLQLFLPGHRLHIQDLYLQPGNTFTVRHTMEPLKNGEAEPERPTGAAPAARAAPGPVPPSLPPSPPPSDAPPPPTGSRSSADAYGAVRIRVQPGHDLVLIDGERWNGGSADEMEVQLPPGRHTIEVRKDGYRDYLTEISVKAGETTKLDVALAAAR